MLANHVSITNDYIVEKGLYRQYKQQHTLNLSRRSKVYGSNDIRWNPLKDSRWKRSKLNRESGEGSVVWHRAMGRANRSSERPFVPGSSFLLRKPPFPSTPSIATSNASRIPKSYLHPNTFPADGNALSKSAKSCADFVSPKFSPGTMEYFAARRSLIGLAFNPNFHFRSIAALEKLVLRRPRFLPPGLP